MLTNENLKKILDEGTINPAKLTKVNFNLKGLIECKLVSNGILKGNNSERLFFVRYLLDFGKKQIITLEFRSISKDFGKIHSFRVVNLSNNKDLEMHFKNDAPSLDIFLSELHDFKNIKTESFNDIRFKIMQAIPQIGLLIVLFDYFYWVYKKYKASKDQLIAERSAEDELNEFLFSNQDKNEPAFDIYSDIIGHINSLINGNQHSVILYGMPGTSKTYLVRRCLHFSKLKPGIDYEILKGSSSNKSQNVRIIYETLWKYNGKIIIFDDFDSVLEDINVINLLKSALDSYPIRIISLPAGAVDPGYNIPTKFKFTGKVIIVTNSNKLDSALLSRSLAINVNYTSEEIISHIEKMLEFLSPNVSMKIKEEVFKYVVEVYTESKKNKLAVKIDMRTFSNIIDLAIAYPNNWKNLAKSLIVINK